MNIGFVGLGVMGFPMAGHLQTAGHRVCVYNRTVEKARFWVEQYGGQLGVTPRDAAAGADIVCLCVGDDDDVRSVVLSQEGVLVGLPEVVSLLTILRPLQIWPGNCMGWQRSEVWVSLMRRSLAGRRER